MHINVSWCASAMHPVLSCIHQSLFLNCIDGTLFAEEVVRYCNLLLKTQHLKLESFAQVCFLAAKVGSEGGA